MAKKVKDPVYDQAVQEILELDIKGFTSKELQLDDRPEVVEFYEYIKQSGYFSQLCSDGHLNGLRQRVDLNSLDAEGIRKYMEQRELIGKTITQIRYGHKNLARLLNRPENMSIREELVGKPTTVRKSTSYNWNHLTGGYRSKVRDLGEHSEPNNNGLSHFITKRRLTEI